MKTILRTSLEVFSNALQPRFLSTAKLGALFVLGQLLTLPAFAQVTVGNVTPDHATPNALQNGRIDVLFQGTNGDMNSATATPTSFVVNGSLTGRRLLTGNGAYTGSYSGNQNTLSFTPDTPAGNFLPGEQISISLTDALQDQGSNALSQPYVWQYRTESGTGTGDFTAGQKTIAFPSNLSMGMGYGDIDGDGDLDCLVASWGTQNLILFNDGFGNFGSIGFFGPGNDATGDIVLGDMDGDGDLDAVVANIGGQNVVYRNDGSGAYSFMANFGTGSDPSMRAAVADFNGDGSLDIAVANPSGQDAVYFNNGNGTDFSLSQDFGNGPNTSDIEAADMDNDGDLDLVLADQGGQNRWYPNDGNGDFTVNLPFSFGTGSDFSTSLGIGDFDLDGDLDLAVANDGAYNQIWQNNGSGVLTHLNSFGNGSDSSKDVCAGDVDGDGDLDLVVVNQNQSNFCYLNDGTGNFSGTNFSFSGNNGARIYLGDGDGDGDLDLAVANTTGGNYLHLNTNGGNFDNDSTLSTASEVTLLPADGTTVSAWELTLNDSGASDGQPTTIVDVTYEIFYTAAGGGNNVSSFNWSLAGFPGVTPVINLGARTVTFSGISLSAADGGSAALTLLVSVKTPPLDQEKIDGMVLGIDLVSVGTQGGGSSITTALPVAKPNDLIADVTSSGFRIITQTSGGQQNIPFFTQPLLEVIDASGNRDQSYSGSITASLTPGVGPAGATLSGITSIQAVNGLVTFTDLQVDLTTTIANQYTLDFSGPGLNSITSDPFQVFSFTADTDSTLVEVSELTSFSSIAASQAVWEFELSDLAAGGEVRPTTITNLNFKVTPANAGTNTASDFEWKINGSLGIVTGDTVAFSGLTIEASTGGSTSFTLDATVQTSVTDPANLDGASLTISLQSATTKSSGSSLGTAFPIQKSNPVAISVQATKLKVVTQPQTTPPNTSLLTQPAVAAVDIRGNYDLDFTGTINAVITSGTGAVGAVLSGTTSLSASAGVASYTNLSINLEATNYSLTFSSGGLSDAISITFSITDVDSDSTLVELFSATSLQSHLNFQKVWSLEITDFATKDILSTTIHEVTFEVILANNGSNTLQDFDWDLNLLGLTPNINIQNNQIKFSAFSISALNGGQQLFDLYAQVRNNVADPLQLDGLALTMKILDFKVSSSGSSISTTTPITKGSTTSVGVQGTELQVVNQPSNALASTPFATQPTVESVDSKGNRDLDANFSISASLTPGTGSAGATLLGTTTVALVSGVATFTNLAVDLAGSNYTIDFAPTAGGSSTTSSAFSIIAGGGGTDLDSTLTQGFEITTLSSIASSTPVWGINLNDLGTSDGLPTTLTSLTYAISLTSNGNNNLNDFTWSLSGVGTPATVNTLAGTVTFNGLNISANDGGSSSIILNTAPRFSVTDPSHLDGLLLQISINGVTSGANSSLIATALPLNKINPLTLSVTASTLKVLSQPASTQQIGIGFPVVVEYVDSQGNRDLDVTGDLVLATRSDLGTVIQDTSSPALNGVANFTGSNEILLSSPSTASVTLTLQDDSTGSINLSSSSISTTPFALNNGGGTTTPPKLSIGSSGGGGGGCVLNTNHNRNFALALLLFTLLFSKSYFFFLRKSKS